MLNQDKCGDAIRSLQESKKSEYDTIVASLCHVLYKDNVSCETLLSAMFINKKIFVKRIDIG